MIEIRDLSYTYENSKSRFHAIRDLNLTVADGEFLCVIGPSGCGKSTLLKLLSGLLRPSFGEILIDGKDEPDPGKDRMIVFQDYSLFPWQTARKNIAFAVKHARPELDAAAQKMLVDHYLEKVGMQDSADRYPSQLSGGMRQRIAIARALAMNRDILLLDEPFGALDAGNKRDLQRQLEALWLDPEDGKKKTIVLVTHDIREAILLGDRILFMENGLFVKEYRPALPRPRVMCVDCSNDSGFAEMFAEISDLFALNRDIFGREAAYGDA